MIFHFYFLFILTKKKMSTEPKPDAEVIRFFKSLITTGLLFPDVDGQVEAKDLAALYERVNSKKIPEKWFLTAHIIMGLPSFKSLFVNYGGHALSCTLENDHGEQFIIGYTLLSEKDIKERYLQKFQSIKEKADPGVLSTFAKMVKSKKMVRDPTGGFSCSEFIQACEKMSPGEKLPDDWLTTMNLLFGNLDPYGEPLTTCPSCVGKPSEIPC